MIDLIKLAKSNTKIKNSMLNFDFMDCLKIVCDEMDVDVKEIKSKSRLRELTDTRYIYFYILSKFTNKKQSEIGGIVNRDRTTVIHGINEVIKLNFLKEKADNIISKYFN